MEYYGIYYNSKQGKWGWRKAIYNSDEAALQQMKTLAVKSKEDEADGKSDRVVFYHLTRLTKGNRVLYNG